MENVTEVPKPKEIVRDATWGVIGATLDPRDDFERLEFEWVNDGSILDYKATITCSHNLAWNAVDDQAERVCEPYITWKYRLFQRDPAKGDNWSSMVVENQSHDPQELVENLIQVIQNRVEKILAEKEKSRQEQEANDLGARMVRESVHLLVDKLTECGVAWVTPIVPGIE